MRFGFTPLFIDADDVDQAVERVAYVMQGQLWDNPKYQTRAAVT
jgi:kynureninase